MRPNGNVTRAISLHPDDATLLDMIAASAGRTRSEIVAEALRAHYWAMRAEYDARTGKLPKGKETGKG